MVLGGEWAWLAASCDGSWPGHSDVLVMGIGLRAWFVGLQQRWSVRLRACLSLVQLHYDSYYSRHYLIYSDCFQVYNCLVVMEFRLRGGSSGRSGAGPDTVMNYYCYSTCLQTRG